MDMREPQSQSRLASWLARYFISQSSFDAWANGTKARNVPLVGLLLLFVALACLAAIVIMGPRLAREGSLLWFGTRTDGIVTRIESVAAGKFKNGAQKYRLTLAYEFAADNGQSYDGVTTRSDVRTLPELQAGDTVGIYYARSNPLTSVAEYNLRIDVYALLLFLPWIAIFGIAAPVTYFRRWRQWRSTTALMDHTHRTT